MGFPPSFLDDLRARVPLAGVVGRRVKLIKKGREYHGLCPFHNEKTPSFTVNEDKGFFHCFGCGAHGDAIGFEMRAGHLSFTEAIEKLAGEMGLAVPVATPEERHREQRRATLHDAMEAACAFFEKQLRAPSGREGLAYFINRGLAEATIARFRLGWAPDSREALKKAVMSEALPESLLVEAGLLKKPEDGGASFDMFRGRVTFPITDRRGRVIAFGARTLGDGQPKYLNSPETPLFHKGATLYGLAHAREQSRQKNQVIAVEGYTDVIALHQAGFDTAVAPLGTALTEQQIEELWRLADEPILCFDGDSAGQRAMARAAERGLPILKPGKSLKFAVLPHPEDPDSLIKAKGPAAMQAVLDGAGPLVEVVWRLTVEGRPLDTPEHRAVVEKELKEKAFSIGDDTIKWAYWNTLREKLRELLRPKRAPSSGGGGGRWKPRAYGDPSLLRSPDGRLVGAGRLRPPLLDRGAFERSFLGLVLRYPALLDSGEVCDRLGEMGFANSDLDNLRQGILKHHVAVRDLDEEGLCAYLRSDGFSRVLDSLLEANAYKIAHPDAVRRARALWEHIYTLYCQKELQAVAQRAVERFAQDPSDDSLVLIEALVTSRAKSVDYEDE